MEGQKSMTYEYKEFLAHHGVKGQKWGVRRYQNPDGTLIHPKGREEKKAPESDTWRKDESKYLSDDELNRRNSRMQREQQYRQNIDNQNPVRKELREAAKKILIGTAISVAASIVTKQYKTAFESGGQFLKSAKAASFLMRKVGRGAKWLM
jgi:hypothetical protein